MQPIVVPRRSFCKSTAARVAAGALLAVLAAGCRLTQALPEGTDLLARKPRLEGLKSLETEAAAGAIRAKANRRVLGYKLYGQFYVLGKAIAEDTSFWKRIYRRVDKRRYYETEVVRWLTETAGEPPVAVDKAVYVADCERLEEWLFSSGFFNARVQFQLKPVSLDRRRQVVVYRITEGPPYLLDSLAFDPPETALTPGLRAAAAAAGLAPGVRYGDALLSDARLKMAGALRNEGYYRFQPTALTFWVDTTQTPGLRAGATRRFGLTVRAPAEARRYAYDSVRVNIRYALTDSLTLRIDARDLPPAARDSLRLRWRRLRPNTPITFRTNRPTLRTLNLNVIAARMLMRPGARFHADSAQLTQRLLQETGIFQNSVIRYLPDDSLGTLDVEGDLFLLKRFSYRLGVEAFQSEDARLAANLPGVGGNVQLNIRNGLRRAEYVSLQGGGSISFYRPTDDADLQFYSQYNARVSVTAPYLVAMRDLVRWAERNKFARFHNPTTTFNLAYYRERPIEFLRISTNAGVHFQWLHQPQPARVQSVFTPLDMTIIDSELFPAFLQRVFGVTGEVANVDSLLNNLTARQQDALLFIIRDFEPRFVSNSAYYRTWAWMYGQRRDRPTWYFRTGGEIGGFIPYVIDWLGARSDFGDGNHKDGLLNGSSRYGQYFRFSVEAKRFTPLGKRAEWVGRAFLGYAQAFNYTSVTPLERRFYAGGTNSVRGWQSNALGPGVYPAAANRIVATGGEYKIEMNLEFRRDLFTPVEAAFFVDAGNVWLSRRSDDFTDEEGSLSRGTLRLGVAAGLGLRLDFSFFVMRLDVGQQVYAPDIPGFVLRAFPRDLGGARIQYNLGVGYPF